MSPAAHTALVIGSIILAFVWVNIPGTSYYTLQLSAVLILIYFILKRLKKAKFWHFAPEALTAEISLLTISFLVLIGSTGNLESLFYPLTYLHLFFLVLALHPVTAITASLGIVLFHVSLLSGINLNNISDLLSIPLLLCMFLFAKKQYEEYQSIKKLYDEDEAMLADEETSMVLFLTTSLRPQLENLLHLAKFPDQNKHLLEQKIESLIDSTQNELEQLPVSKHEEK